MEFVDIILILLYLSSILAAGSVLWSVTKHLRTEKEMQKGLRQSNPAPYQKLAAAVWGSLMVIVGGTALLFKGDLASVMTTTMFITILITMLVVAWASARRK